MIFVFTFLGEFGFELLNWQGVVRRFARTRGEGDTIVCASRGGVDALYENADLYIDIGDVPRYRESRAVQYAAALSDDRLTSTRDWLFGRSLARELESLLTKRIRAAGLNGPIRFIFSSHGTRLRGLKFGRVGYRYALPGVVFSDVCDLGKRTLPAVALRGLDRAKRALLGGVAALDYRADGEIYARLDVDNNEYRRIEPPIGARPGIEDRLGFTLDQPYVLCQARRRDSHQPSPDHLGDERIASLLDALAGRMRVVFLSFDTGRRLDSYSRAGGASPVTVYACRSFAEQSCLVHFARHAVFFTEGDLGSHTYVPPFMGRDVTVVAPRSVFALESAPVAFWNGSVFRFGGQMIPEPVDADECQPDALVARVLARLPAA